MARKKRVAYTPAQRKTILEAALKDKLTAEMVQKKFGVTPVTYYSWRKKYGAARRRGSAATKPAGRPAAVVAVPGVGNIDAQVRAAVQQRVQQMVQDIVRAEVASYVDRLFGGAAKPRRRGRPRKKK